MADVLPTLIVEDLFAMRPKYPPSITLRLNADSKHDEKLNRRDLRNLVDFSPFVMRNGQQLTYMSVRIEGPLQLSWNEPESENTAGPHLHGAKRGI